MIFKSSIHWVIRLGIVHIVIFLIGSTCSPSISDGALSLWVFWWCWRCLSPWWPFCTCCPVCWGGSSGWPGCHSASSISGGTCPKCVQLPCSISSQDLFCPPFGSSNAFAAPHLWPLLTIHDNYRCNWYCSCRFPPMSNVWTANQYRKQVLCAEIDATLGNLQSHQDRDHTTIGCVGWVWWVWIWLGSGSSI